MQEQFAPPEFALELKELGFNEWCIAIYIDGNLNISSPKNDFFRIAAREGEVINEYLTEYVAAPLWQQCFDFFREKFSLNVQINWDYQFGRWYFKIENYSLNYKSEPSVVARSKGFETFEYTRLECLKKLILIAKQNKKC